MRNFNQHLPKLQSKLYLAFPSENIHLNRVYSIPCRQTTASAIKAADADRWYQPWCNTLLKAIRSDGMWCRILHKDSLLASILICPEQGRGGENTWLHDYKASIFEVEVFGIIYELWHKGVYNFQNSCVKFSFKLNLHVNYAWPLHLEFVCPRKALELHYILWEWNAINTFAYSWILACTGLIYRKKLS